jgi:uncharacterized protein (DUF952 family)
MIYRIAEADDWAQAQQTGEFVSTDLAHEGFIHCSEQHQILRTAQKYYAGKTRLILLEIDEAEIATYIKREDLTGRGEMFPHVYGPIPVRAISRYFNFIETATGFVMPF